MLEAWPVADPFQGRTTAAIDGCFEQLAQWLPATRDPALAGQPDPLLNRLREPGLLFAEALAEIALRLQRFASGASELSLALTGLAGPQGVGGIALEFEEEGLARLCLASSARMLQATIGRGEYDFDGEQAQLKRFVDDYCLGPSTRSIVTAARRRGIAVRRLDRYSLVQLGHGAAQRRIFTAQTDRTSSIAETAAHDKELTKQLLRGVGVPVPAGRLATSAADAWQAALETGLPVVVKPTDANHGRGVSINLSDRAQIEAAYDAALDHSDGVIVEQFALGVEHRLLVVGDRVAAAIRGEPEQVIGDGEHTIAELVAIANQDPLRGRDFARRLTRIELDLAATLTIEQQGYTRDSKPPAGATVLIHRNGDLTTDVTDEMHPDAAAMAVLAAQTVGLDIAGIDLITPDISRPLEEQGGMILEVNAGPGLHMHLHPQHGKPRPVGETIVECLFPAGHDGRIPLIGVAGASAGEQARLIGRLLRAAGHAVGTVTADGVWVNDAPRRVSSGSLLDRARELTLHPQLTAMVVEIGPAAVFDEGLPFDRFDVLVFGSAGEQGWVDVTLKVLGQTLGLDGRAVLAIDDPAAERISGACAGPFVWLSHDGARAPKRTQRAGDRLVIDRKDSFGLLAAPMDILGDFVDQGSLCHPRSKGDPNQHAAALGALWAMGIPPSRIRDAQRNYHLSKF